MLSPENVKECTHCNKHYADNYQRIDEVPHTLAPNARRRDFVVRVGHLARVDPLT